MIVCDECGGLDKHLRTCHQAPNICPSCKRNIDYESHAVGCPEADC
jgi:hypothetical protein